MEEIATGCKELTHLEVNGCHNIGALGQESVGKSCQYVFLYAKLSQNVIDAQLFYATNSTFKKESAHGMG